MLARISIALLAFILAGDLPLHGRNQPPSGDAVGLIANRSGWQLRTPALASRPAAFRRRTASFETSGQGHLSRSNPGWDMRIGIDKLRCRKVKGGDDKTT